MVFSNPLKASLSPLPLTPSCTWRLRSLRSRSCSGIATGHAPPHAPHRHGAAAEPQERVVQRYPHGARLPARPAQGRGERQVLGLLRPFEERGDDRTYWSGVGRAVGVAAGLAVDGTDVEAGAAPDAV